MAERAIDFAALPSHAGEELGVSSWFEITQPMVDRFADLTHDHNWIHVDPARAARESPYRAPIANGFLTLSLLSHLMHDAIRIEGGGFGINVGFDRLRMTDGVPVGSRIRGRFKLAELEPFEGGYKIAWDVTIEREGAGKPALIARWRVRLMR